MGGMDPSQMQSKILSIKISVEWEECQEWAEWVECQEWAEWEEWEEWWAEWAEWAEWVEWVEWAEWWEECQEWEAWEEWEIIKAEMMSKENMMRIKKEKTMKDKHMNMNMALTVITNILQK